VHFQLGSGGNTVSTPFYKPERLPTRAAALPLPNIAPIAVEVAQTPQQDGSVWYHYSVSNNSDSDLVAVQIGYDYDRGNPELGAAPIGWTPDQGIPASSVASPSGWDPSFVTTEESASAQLLWQAQGGTTGLAPGKAMTGLDVRIPGVDTAFSAGHWTVVLADGRSLTGTFTALTPPAAPSTLAGSAVTEGSIRLTWSDESLNEQGLEVERSDDGTRFNLLVTLPANTTEYVDTSALAGSTYLYRIRATNAAGTSDYAGPVSVTTPRTVTLASLAASPAVVRGGRTAQLQITLSGPAPTGGSTVTLTSSKPRLVGLPGSVTIPEGQSSAVVTITTRRPKKATRVVITGTGDGGSLQALLRVRR
jgi:hypothetical protein